MVGARSVAARVPGSSGVGIENRVGEGGGMDKED